MELENKVALVTGSSKGIGKAIAIDLAKKGYNIVINYNSDDLSAKKVLDEILSYNVKAITIKADVSKEYEIEKMVNSIINEFGRIDVLVNNAGIAIDCEIDEKTSENFHEILGVNLVGPFMLSREVGKYMMKNKYGKIVNIASTNGIDTYYSFSLDYDASKAGLINLTHNLAEIYKPYVNVNCICPGWVNTEMNKELDEEFVSEECQKIKLGRFAEPEEIAKVVSFLVSDDASYLNDAIIRVDGGEK